MGKGLPAGRGWRWKVYWGELMHRLSNNSICSLCPPGPRLRGAGRQRGSCWVLPPPSLPHPCFPWQHSFFFWPCLVGGKSSEFRRGSAPAGSLAVLALCGI